MNSSVANPRKFYWNEEDRKFIVATCHANWPQEVREVIHRADLACNNTFIFTHRWDMERCEEEVRFHENIDWNYRHNEDLEWLVMLNRARYMGELGQAYWLTGNEKYVVGFIRLMKDWLQQNPLTEQEVRAAKERNYNVKDTWRKLDSGIRITHWLKGYFCIRNNRLWGEAEEKLFREGIRKHGMYLSIAYLPHDRQSNWGFLETNGLFQLALLFPELDAANEWLQIAVQRLMEMCPIQVFQDGMHNEQCTMYHHEVLHCLFESVWLGRINGLELPPMLESTLNRMYSASLAFVQPNGHQPMLGDSDGTDIGDVLCRGAVLFNRGDLKSMAYSTLDYEGIWYFGEEGYDRFQQLIAQPPVNASIYLKDSGYSFMRSSWDANANYLAFDGGHMDVIRAHGHDDFLHISLFAHGKEFLTDIGRYTYMETPERRYFMESLQHNTISVDGQTISTYVDAWRWQDVANPIDRFWSSSEDYDYVQAGHDGYWRLEDPVHILRQILFVKPDYWILVDTCRSHGQHEYRLPFHFAEGIFLDIDSRSSIRAQDVAGGPVLHLVPLTPLSVQKKTSWISRNYNERTPSLMAEMTRCAKGFVKFVTLLYPARDENEQPPTMNEIDILDSYGNLVPGNLATAVRIQKNDGSFDEIVFSHQGPKGYQFGTTHITGEVLLTRQGGYKSLARAMTIKV